MPRRLSLLLLVAACGSKSDTPPVDTDDDTPDIPVDTFVPPTESDVPDDSDPPLDPPAEPCAVPEAVGLAGACDLSVGSAEVYVDTVGARPLGLQVNETGAGTPGGYNGDGLGHRAIAGFHGYDKIQLDELGGIELVGEKLQGTFQVRVGVQVDLDCGQRDFRLLEVALERVVDTVDAGEGRTRWRLPLDGPVWTADEAVTVDSEVLVQKTTATGATGSSLLGLMAAFPNACLRNVDGGFPDLPRRKVVSAITLAIGSRATYGLGGLWEFVEVKIGDDVHLPPT